MSKSKTTKKRDVSKKTRFEVFKRDKFTCQYCGLSAPDVTLHVDHIEPHSKGGSGELLNLLTSCSSCNSGKGAVPLSDDSALQKQKAMLNTLQERREQIEMMMEWQRGLRGLADETLTQLAAFWTERAGWILSQHGLGKLRKWLAKFSTKEVIEAMNIAADYYLVRMSKPDGPGNVTQESFSKAFNAIPGICVNRRRESENPNIAIAQHVVSVARKHFPEASPQRLAILRKQILSAIEDHEADADLLFSMVYQASTISGFEYKLGMFINQHETV